jgi:glyoxylase-like metal-dependent hydrolase (beta-lactamase superfamily II)
MHRPGFRIASAFAAACLTIAVQAQTPQREITKITGEIYRFRNAGHYSVLAVTPAGIIATDPIDRAAAEWLKAELTKRFKQPVRYLIYSHAHADHVSGGEVFADTATVIAHERAKSAIEQDKVPTAVPQKTLTDALTIELGGTTVELSYVGRNHSDGSIVMRFPKEGVLFAVDFIPVKSVAYRDFPNAYFPDWIESLKRVEAMQFEILAPGHGALGNKDDVRAHRQFLEDLHGQVAKAVKEGKSLAETQKAVDMSKYSQWQGFNDIQLNVEGMYRIVKGA